jgi:P4 family phage/plasmid primase-like protien
MELLYDDDFYRNVDTNKQLMGFTNGVLDFKNKLFRIGNPQDYITKTTGIPYIPHDELKTDDINNITDFMSQLFPVVELNTYMWEHLASVLIGTNINQTFNIYLGSGSNGKSILTDLMSQTLGEYKGMVPISLVTDKRGSIGSTSSEVVQLKGIRYAVMQEPSKDMKINEGIMKELTGGDPIQARALYSESEIFEPQFSLAVCTNSLFVINSNDDGTWRRIRICEFMSKFVDSSELKIMNEEDDDMNQQHIFPKDKNLKQKLALWAPIFASMLVNKAFETDGVTNDCDIVLAASNKYRQEQDIICTFIKEKVIEEEGKSFTILELFDEFKCWYTDGSNPAYKQPKRLEVRDYFINKFKKNYKSNGSSGLWTNLSFIPNNKNDNNDNETLNINTMI